MAASAAVSEAFFSAVPAASPALVSAKEEEEPIVLTMLLMGRGSEIGSRITQQLQTAADEVASNVEIRVKVLTDEQYYAALMLGLAAGDPGDFISVQPRHAGKNAVISLAEQGYLEPLSDLDLSGLDTDYFLENLGWNGEIYALGTANGGMTLGTLYNKEIFAEYELDIPTCWDEFLECCQTLLDNGVIPITMGDRDSFACQFGLYQLAANVIYPENPDYDQGLWSGETHFTDEGTWEKVIEMYGELYERGFMDPDSPKLGNSGALDKFYKGGAAMIFSLDIYIDETDAEQFGIFPLPGNEKGEQTWVCSATSASGFGVYSGSQQKELCKKILLRYAQNQQNEEAAALPEEYLQAIEEGRRGDICNQNWPYGVENHLERSFLQYVIYGDITAEEVARSTQVHLEQLLSRYGQESEDG